MNLFVQVQVLLLSTIIIIINNELIRVA